MIIVVMTVVMIIVISKICTLREVYPYLEFLWSVFSRIWTEYGELRIQSECGKTRTRNTTNKDIFLAVVIVK